MIPVRPGRIDRKIEFSLPDLDGRANILRIHAKSMSVERDIRWELISRLCPNATGAELRSVATEAGMFAIVSWPLFPAPTTKLSQILTENSAAGSKESGY